MLAQSQNELDGVACAWPNCALPPRPLPNSWVFGKLTSWWFQFSRDFQFLRSGGISSVAGLQSSQGVLNQTHSFCSTDVEQFWLCKPAGLVYTLGSFRSASSPSCYKMPYNLRDSINNDLSNPRKCSASQISYKIVNHQLYYRALAQYFIVAILEYFISICYKEKASYACVIWYAMRSFIHSLYIQIWH